MRFPVACMALCLAALAVGCLEYRETIRMEANGSGHATIVISAPSNWFLRSTGHEGFKRDRALELLSRRAIQERFEAHGLTLTRYETSRNDSVWTWTMGYHFVTIEAFRQSRENGRGVALRRTGEGSYEIELYAPVERYARELFSLRDGAEDEGRSAGALLDDASFLVTLEMPTRVISAPGAARTANRAAFSWRYDSADTTFQAPPMRAIFDADGLRWPVFETLPDEDFDEEPYLGPSHYMD